VGADPVIEKFASMFGRRRWLWMAVAVSTATLVWLGYGAISNWQRSAGVIRQRRAELIGDFLVRALTKDMRAVQSSLFLLVQQDDLLNRPTELDHRIAATLVRYPYPEAFFVWDAKPAADSMVFYSRSARRPAWLAREEEEANPLPVVIDSDELTSRHLLARIKEDSAHVRRFSIFESQVGGSPYQVIAVLFYDPILESLDGVFGFMVNLQWVRTNYFPEITAHTTRLLRPGSGLILRVLDARGQAVFGGDNQVTGSTGGQRTFPMMFFDPILAPTQAPADFTHDIWTAQAVVSDDPALQAANRLAIRSTMTITALAAIVLAVGFLFTVQAARTNARIAEMRSEFVAAVTHELRTPIASIQALSETLASGRSESPEMSREYAQLAVQETKRLKRLIDNLLAYARVTDVAEVYVFEPVAVDALVAESLKPFARQLADNQFDVHVDVPAELPPVRVDQAAMQLVFANLLDNAVRYSDTRRHLTISARMNTAERPAVVIKVIDQGVGIPTGDLPDVTRRFFRGRGVRPGGSGLGLAIAQRIVTDHNGTLTVQSEVGAGTTVSVTLPTADIDDAQAHSGR
jgi:signal transduction histidine kinase